MNRSHFGRLAAVTAGAMLAMNAHGSIAAMLQDEDDETTTVSAVEVIATMDRLPLTTEEFEAMQVSDRGSPRYSLEQVASFVCESNDSDRAIAATQYYDSSRIGQAGREAVNNARFRTPSAALGALQATVRFEETKEAYRRGEATLEELVAADDDRDVAVTRMISMDFRALNQIQRTQEGNLTIEAKDYRVETFQGEQVLIAFVELVNSGSRRALVPDITLKALDRNARVLADVTYIAEPRLYVEGNDSQVLELVFLNMPLYTHDVKAHFGAGSFNRNSRNCAAAAEYHDGGLPLGVAEASALGLDLGSAPTARVELSGSRMIQTDDGPVLEIDASIINMTTVTLPNPGITIQIINENDEPVGQIVIDADQIEIPAGEVFDLTFQTDDAERLPAANGQNPLELLTRLSVLVN